MEWNMETALARVKVALREARRYQHAASVLNFDRETVCPPAEDFLDYLEEKYSGLYELN